ncbi:hypothetical protein Fcan01_23837 [Folsomia candida]|uniref:Uncharacterized protein n=1 Tax=Folsomia candida TaxID=158441 RepID=A0A226D8R1_FOLCA|nr:hypothetical protein Fcan01_23837 [Folsomia candida]
MGHFDTTPVKMISTKISLLGTWGFLCFFLSNFYQEAIYSALTTQILPPLPETIEELGDSGLKIVTSSSKFKDILLPDLIDNLDKSLFPNFYTTLRNLNKTLTHGSDTPFRVVTLAMVRKNYLFGVVSRIFAGLRESGIYEKWIETYVTKFQSFLSAKEVWMAGESRWLELRLYCFAEKYICQGSWESGGVIKGLKLWGG